MTPIIGIPCGTFHDRAWCPPSFGHRKPYIDAIVNVGGAPLLIPPIQDEKVLRTIYERIDGLLLAGGGDIAPTYYGEEPHKHLGPVDVLRDQAEMPLARWAFAEGKPILGICRGMQVLNVALGGSLYQDIPAQLETLLEHNSSYTREDWTYMAHKLNLDPASQLAHVLGLQNMMTNSLHHQSIKELASGLQVVAWAPDGVVEAVEGLNGHFVMGVQCHPEALQGQADTRWQALFAAFVTSCVAYQQQTLLVA